MKNSYEIRGEVTAIFLLSEKYGNMETLISTDKLERAKEFQNRWRPVYSKFTNNFYVVGYSRPQNGKQNDVKLHRWIANAPKELQVDHVNHDTLDNTDDNLRVITKDENNQNRKGAQKNSKSGIRVECIGTKTEVVGDLQLKLAKSVYTLVGLRILKVLNQL